MSPDTPTTDPVLEHALEITQALETQSFTGTSSDGLVTVTMSGAQEALAVKIEPKILQADEKTLSASVCEAINAARKEAATAAEKLISSFTTASGDVKQI